MTVIEFRVWITNISNGIDGLNISAARKEETFRQLLAALLSREHVEVPRT